METKGDVSLLVTQKYKGFEDKATTNDAVDNYSPGSNDSDFMPGLILNLS